MLRNPVSICMISLGVVVGVYRILFMILSNIICMCFISFLVVVHVSVAYGSVGIRHVSMSFHIVFISILLKLLFPAKLKIVWIVASAPPYGQVSYLGCSDFLFLNLFGYFHLILGWHTLLLTVLRLVLCCLYFAWFLCSHVVFLLWLWGFR